MAITSNNTVIQQFKLISGGVLCAALVAGCSPPVDIDPKAHCPRPMEKPIVISKEELRSKVVFTQSETIKENGKIVVYNDYLLVNEPNIGIHIYDNIQPELPQPLGLLKVPGNIDFFVRDNIIHATSYIDLVQIDISDLDNVREVGRSEDIFSANLFHHGWYPKHQYNIDSRESVVVGIEFYTEPKEGCDEEMEE